MLYLKMSVALKLLRNINYPIYRTKNCTMLFRGFIISTPNRNFSCTSQLCIKMFMEHENKYAYDILESKGYAISLETAQESTALTKEQFNVLLQEDWAQKSPQDIFTLFPKFGLYCSQNSLCISGKLFDNYIDNLTDHLKNATDKELVSVFYSLNKWPETDSIRTRNYIEVWAALDEECINRIRGWSIDEMLTFVSLFYMLNVTRVSDFSLKCLQKLASKAKQLTPSQLVQTMFFVGILRKSPFDMHNLEVHLANHFTEFTVDDLAIMSMGFFKSKTPIRSMELVSKIISTVIDNSKDIHEVSLAALLKVIRYSKKITVDDTIYRMLDVLQHEVPRLSVMCNVHIALVGTATLSLHKDCLTKIADEMINNMSKMRLKDLERLVLTYGTFNLIPKSKEDFFSKVIDELRRPERDLEIIKHGRSFACCISYLGLLSIYPVDLMSKILSPDFLDSTYGKQSYNYGKEILTINNSAEIFCGDAEMNRLSDKVAKVLAKKYTDYMPSETFKKQFNVSERMILDVMRVLKETRGGSEYVIGDHILTHHQRGDIIICNNLEGVPMDILEAFRSNIFGSIRRPPDNNIWIVFVIAGRNAIINGSDTPTGQFQVKIKELQKLGFHAALVPWSIYNSIGTVEKKTEYLNGLIKHAVKI